MPKLNVTDRQIDRRMDGGGHYNILKILCRWRRFSLCFTMSFIYIITLCPLYNHIRSHYIQKYFSHPSPATLISLISSKSHNVIRDIAGFIAGKLHSLNIVWLFCTMINVLVYMYVCYMSIWTCTYNVICTCAEASNCNKDYYYYYFFYFCHICNYITKWYNIQCKCIQLL